MSYTVAVLTMIVVIPIKCGTIETVTSHIYCSNYLRLVFIMFVFLSMHLASNSLYCVSMYLSEWSLDVGIQNSMMKGLYQLDISF